MGQLAVPALTGGTASKGEHQQSDAGDSVSVAGKVMLRRSTEAVTEAAV